MRKTLLHLINSRFWRNGLSGSKLSVYRPDDLVQLAVNHLARDFPNSQREHCPPLDTLDAMLRAAELPADEIREHLVTCSKCFNYYRAELARRRTVEPIVMVRGSTVNDSRKPRLVPVLVTSLAAVITVAGLVFMMFMQRREAGERANLNPTSSREDETAIKGYRSGIAAIAPEPSVSPSLQPKPSNSSTEIISSSVTQNTSIDFNAYDPLRGAGRPQPPKLSLRTGRNKLTIKLPAGSAVGKYQVKLADPFANTLQSVEATSQDGTRLRLDLNLSSIEPGEYLICLASDIEVPQCVPVMVRPARRKNS